MLNKIRGKFSFENLLSSINYGSGMLGSLIIVGLMFFNAYATVARRFFRVPVPGSVEISSAFLPLTAFLGMALALEARRHINIDLILRQFGKKTQTIIKILTTTIILALAIIIVWKGSLLAIDKLHDKLESQVRLPVFPFYAAVPFGGLLLSVQCMRDIRGYVYSLTGKGKELEDSFKSPHTVTEQETIDI